MLKKVWENQFWHQPHVDDSSSCLQTFSVVNSLSYMSNLSPRLECRRDKCIGEGGEGRSLKCYWENAGYEGECTRCLEGSYAYIRETSKTAYTRVTQHMATNYRAAAIAGLPQPDNSDPLIRPSAAKSWLCWWKWSSKCLENLWSVCTDKLTRMYACSSSRSVVVPSSILNTNISCQKVCSQCSDSSSECGTD